MLKENIRKTLLSLIIIAMAGFFALTHYPFQVKAWSPADFVDPISRGITEATMENNNALFQEFFQTGEDRYHLNKETMQEYGEGMNVSIYKGSAPEVMLTFNPADPKEGEKLTATALPMYFSTPNESLYFTWYLKHEGCDLNKNPSQRIIDLCDRDDDNEITVEDWKIEAMRLLANGGFRYEDKTDYDPDIASDNDGYKAHMGGDANIRPTTNYHCYIHDFEDGDNYEITDAEWGFATAFYYDDGTEDGALCAEENVRCVEDDTLSCSPAFSHSYTVDVEYQICRDSYIEPFCDPSSCTGTGDNCEAICPDGTYAYCATDSHLDPECSGVATDRPCSSAGDAISYCTTGITYTEFTDTRVCEHLFPNAPDYETGDNFFPVGEEEFWRTNPEDPDTANSGNGDEANVAGLGMAEFTWNYAPNDRVGVVVEGESMVNTKHDDSSMMIMWALPKNKCEVENKGSYIKEIKGYNVEIPTAGVDINGCLRDNLIDPREGGQPSNLEVFLSYFPENPVNDPSGDNMGDEVTVQSIISNADKSTSQLYYKWEIRASQDGTINLDNNNWVDITDIFSSSCENCISLTEGNNVSSLSFDLNFNEETIGSYLSNGVGYLRVYVDVEESFDKGMTRSGNSDIIIKFVSSGKKIIPYITNIKEDGTLSTGEAICQDDIMQKSVCFVVKNEIIGVSISDSDLRNFSWKLNGEPLICNSSISSSCSDSKQANVNFFPVTGDVGDTYTLTLDANDISFNESELNSVHLVKNFQVVAPSVNIISPDETFKPKILGTYYDLDGHEFEDESEMIFQAGSGSTINMKAEFFPSFIGATSNLTGDNPRTKVQWLVDSEVIEEEGEGDERINLSLLANKPAGTVFNIALNALYEQPNEIRKALADIWGISQFDSTESYLSSSIQIEMLESVETAAVRNGKILANLLSYIPSQTMFLLRIGLTILIMIVISGAVLSFSPRNSTD